MTHQPTVIRDYIYLDAERVRSIAAQLDLPNSNSREDSARIGDQRLFNQLEPMILGREGTLQIDASFNFERWTANGFADGQFVSVKGMVRLLDFNWLTLALSGFPAVLKKMNKIEMAALRNSEEGRRMSKNQIQQRSQENQAAIAKVEEFKIEDLGDVMLKLYGDIVRIKIRPSTDQPRAIFVGSAYINSFYDSPAALNQKHGVEIDAGWTVFGQVNVPGQPTAIQPMPVGNQMEDSFEHIALLMNNAFRLANAPAFPAFSFTPIVIHRASKQA